MEWDVWLCERKNLTHVGLGCMKEEGKERREERKKRKKEDVTRGKTGRGNM